MCWVCTLGTVEEFNIVNKVKRYQPETPTNIISCSNKDKLMAFGVILV
jgi:aspartate carbamoyltransferase regulatory subunit